DILDLFRDRNNDGDGLITRFKSGNSSQSLQWTHQGPKNAHSNFTLFRSKYKYDIENIFEENKLIAISDIEDYGASFIWQKDSLPRNGILKTGFDWTRHAVSPNVITTTGTISEWKESGETGGKTANEIAAHIQYEWLPHKRLRLATGVRASSSMVN